MPRISPHLVALTVDDEQTALIGEEERHLVRSDTLGAVLRLADGTRSTDEIVRAVSGRLSAVDAHYALALASARGYLGDAAAPETELVSFLRVAGCVASDAGSRLRNARLDVLSLGGLDTEPMKRALRESNLNVTTDPTMVVVLVSDYCDPRLEDINMRFRNEGRTWVLVKPTGLRVWVGPVFHESGPCWRCLAQRLEMNHPLEHWLRKNGKMEGPPPMIDHLGSRNLAMAFAAEQIVRWIVEPGSESRTRPLVTFDMRSLEVNVHPVLRRPQCRVCGNPNWVAQRVQSRFEMESRIVRHTDGGYRTLTPQSLMDRCRHLVDCITGAVVSLEPVPERDQRVHAVIAGHYFAPPSAASPSVDQVVRCSLGKGRTNEQALISALGEAIERYSAAFQGDEPRTFAPRRQVGDAVEIQELLLFSEQQYRARDRNDGRATGGPERIPPPYDELKAIHWTRVWSLTRPGHSRFVPSSMCYVGVPETDEAELFPYNSNGDAAGSCVEEAVLQALFEVIERDAVGIWWYNRLVRPAVDIAAFRDPFMDEICGQFAEQDIAIRLLDVTSDLEVPVFVAYGETPDRRRFSIGFGCHLDPRIAAERALTEFCQLYDPTGHRPLPWQPQDLGDTGFLQPDFAAPRRTLSAGERTTDIREAVLYVVQILAKAGLEVLVLDRTRPDLELAVVRVIVPGLRHFWKRLAPGRLYDVPVRMGWRRGAALESEMNPVPLRL